MKRETGMRELELGLYCTVQYPSSERCYDEVFHAQLFISPQRPLEVAGNPFNVDS